MIPLRSLVYGQHAHAIRDLVCTEAFRREAVGESAERLAAADSPDALWLAYIDALYSYADHCIGYQAERQRISHAEAIEYVCDLFEAGSVERKAA